MTGRRQLHAVLLALGLLCGGGATAYHEADEPSDGTVRSFHPLEPALAVPDDLAVHLVGAGDVPLAAFRGQVVLLNLWATWCPPCIRELPALDRLQGRLGGDDFQVVAVSIDAGGALAAAPYFERLGIAHLGLYVDPAKRVGGLLPVDVLPATFVITRDGRVTRFLRSYVDWDDPQADAFVYDLISAAR